MFNPKLKGYILICKHHTKLIETCLSSEKDPPQSLMFYYSLYSIAQLEPFLLLML